MADPLPPSLFWRHLLCLWVVMADIVFGFNHNGHQANDRIR